jgi:apolipoprotein N-acyltransferase
MSKVDGLRPTHITLSVLSGIMLVFAFPPFDLYPLAWFGLIPLFVAVHDKGPRASFLLGLISGVVFYLGTTYWIFHSVYFYGGIPGVPALLMVLLLSSYLGLYPAAFSWSFTLLIRKTRFTAILIAPVLWVTLELVRAYAFTGFPWLLLGYSQYRFLHIIQIADITGIYGISFLVAGINGLLFDVAVLWPKRSRRMPLFAPGLTVTGIVVFILLLCASLLYGTWRLRSGEGGRQVRVSVIQGNIEQEKKWDKRFQKDVINTYRRLSLGVLGESPDIIIWPESALPFIYDYDTALTEEFLDFQRRLKTHLLTGSVVVKDVRDGRPYLSNSAILLSPEGKVLSIYDKIHLVPYGEYVPLRRLFPFIEKLVVSIGDFVPGDEYVVMKSPFARIAPLICYEIIFPGLVRKFVNHGADMIVTITNDAWFGRTSAPYQHFSMAVLRAVENRAPVVRAANTGISGFIDSRGRIIKRGDIFTEETLTGEVTLRREKTFYTRYGDLFAFLCIIITILLITDTFFPEGKRGR